MRFSELRFQKYGLLTDRIIDLPEGPSDLHVLAGPNEAGKSMMRVGIEDWLYGFHPRSGMAIGYQPALLRVGGTLRGDPPFPSLRKKGNRNTLVDLSDQPISDAILLAALGTCQTRDQFEQQHCLHHAAMRSGGATLAGIDSDQQASSAIFETTSGVTGLSELVDVLENQAGLYFSRRKRSDVMFYTAEDRHEKARSTLSDVRVMESKHATLKRNKKQADEACEALESERIELARQAARVSRILQLAHHVDAYKGAIAELDALGNPGPMSPNKIAEAIDAGQKLTQARAEREGVAKKVQSAREAADSIALDALVTAAESEIDQISSEMVFVGQSKQDLPGQNALAQDGLEAIRSLCRSLNWDVAPSGDIAELDAILQKLPASNLRVATAKILQDLRDARTKNETANQAHIERQSEYQSAETRLKGIAPAVDVSALEAVLKRAREHAGKAPDAGLIDQLQKKIGRISENLEGWDKTATTLLQLKLPSQEEVRRTHSDLTEAETVERDASRAVAEMERAISDARQRLDAAEQVRDAPPNHQTLVEARDARSAGWSAFRTGSKSIDAEGDAYETLVIAADDIADQRFDFAQAAHEIDAARHDLEAKQEKQQELSRTWEKHGATVAKLRADWTARLASIGVPYLLGPDLEAWRTQLQTCQEYQEQIEERQTLIQTHESRSEELALALREALAEPEQVDTLDALMDALEGRLTKSATNDALRQQANDSLRKAEVALHTAAKILDAAQGRLNEQRLRWTAHLEQLRLPADMDEHVAEVTVTSMAAIEQKEQTTRTALTRARDMSATIARFESRVKTLAKALGINEQVDAIAMARLISQRLTSHRAQLAKLEDRKDQLAKTLAELDAANEAVQQAENNLAGLKTLFAVDDDAALAEAAARHQQAGILQLQRDSAQQAVIQGAGAIQFEQVVQEVDAADRDALVPDQQRIQADLEKLQFKLNAAAVTQADCERDLTAVDGSERAAIAESDRVSALADMEESLANFVQNKAGAIILGWAVRKHRKRSQSPLLHRASAFFKELTEDRYEGFDIDDSGPKPVLKAVPSGSQNWLGHDMLSDGTLDVMYLALRLAALDLLAQERPIPPLIADDLFINLDEVRARCGLKLLQRLSKNFQVIFLTHQLGLVDMVRSTCTEVNVQTMERLALS